jgi:hypothetical protein
MVFCASLTLLRRQASARVDRKVMQASGNLQIRDILAYVGSQFEADTITPGNGLIENQNFVRRRFGEAVRPESY